MRTTLGEETALRGLDDERVADSLELLLLCTAAADTTGGVATILRRRLTPLSSATTITTNVNNTNYRGESTKNNMDIFRKRKSRKKDLRYSLRRKKTYNEGVLVEKERTLEVMEVG